MPQPVRLAGVALVIGSGLALGALGMSGALAAILFPTMRDLDPVLPMYRDFPGDHWSLAAGVIAERVFLVAFAVAGVALALCLAAVAALFVVARAGRPPLVRASLLVATVALLATQAAWLQPRMNRAAEAYRSAAAAGETDRASEAKSSFDAMHPTASRLVGGSTVASLALFVAAAWSLSAGPRRDAGPAR